VTPDRPVCLVTGAGGALGGEFCRRQAGQYQIAATWHRRLPLVATQDQTVFDPFAGTIEAAKPRDAVFALRADLRRPKQIERVVDRVLERFGRVDIVVNMAVVSVWAPMLDGRRILEAFEESFRINVGLPLSVATVLAERCWADQTAENRSANRNVINVSSTAGLYVHSGYGQSLYSATKAALNFLTCHMAAEFEPLGVRVNALAPDSFSDPIHLDTVLGGLDQLSRGQMTGAILVQERQGESWLMNGH
jgi:NAD(P)-dependent dehydrogenase (short-subunit alcohol dehydrogenase family)